jgi:hypothetical protein
MKEFKITFRETVYFTTIIEAESEEKARDIFDFGDWNDCEEVDREFCNGIVDIKEV